MRHVESKCHVKYLEKKAAFDKMVADNKAAKALKKQQILLKDAPKTYVANATTSTPSLPPSAQYDFTTSARVLVATTYATPAPSTQRSLLLSDEYIFGPTAHTYVVGSTSD